MQRGRVFNIQRYSVQDGPGIRTTVFMKGCPLSCQWCHNPEGQSPEPELLVFEHRCIRCGACVTVCPNASAQIPVLEPLRPIPANCSLCGACVAACPTEARQMAGDMMTVDEVLAVVLKDRVFYEDSQGGVTFSGGDPLMQPDFLQALLEACKKVELHTAVDTCGLASRETILALAPLTDLFLYDLKLVDAQKHRQFTGASNQVILENLNYLGRHHTRVWLRIPVIPGINDAPESMDATAQLAASLPGIRQVNLLPYHPSGIAKFQRLGQAYPLAATRPPTQADLDAITNIFKSHGLVVLVGG